MDVNLWIRNPYPFRTDELAALKEALRRMYGAGLVYIRDHPMDWVSIDHTNMTTARQLANTLTIVHQQWAFLNPRVDSHLTADVIEIRRTSDGRPDWAKV